MTMTAAVRQSERTVRKRPDYVRQVEKCIRAATMRREGKPTREIAAELGYQSTSGAQHAVRFGLELLQLSEPADVMRQIISNRLERLLNVVWPAAESGDLDAIDRVLSIVKEEAKLHGLYAPIRVDLTDEVRRVADELGIPHERAIAIAQRTMKSIPSRVA